VGENGAVESRENRAVQSPDAAARKDFLALAAAAAEHEHSTHRLWSGSEHDAKYVADRYPADMIFVPCKGELSHNEAEWTSKEECARGAAVLLGPTLRVARLVRMDAPSAFLSASGGEQSPEQCKIVRHQVKIIHATLTRKPLHAVAPGLRGGG
jgi:hypothetical protein